MSLAALVFSGQTSQLFVRGAIALLLTSAISNIVVSFRTTLDPVVIGLPNTIAVVIAGAVAGFTSPDPATVFVFLGAVSFLTGAAFYALGKAGGGQIIRFLPYPVLTAYVGGVSWLLVQGGVKLMRNAETDVASLVSKGFWADWQFWTAGLVLTVLLGTAQQRKWPPVSQSILIIGAIIGFFAIALSVTSLSELETSGWVIGERNTDGASWHPISPNELGSVDLGSLRPALPAVFATVFIAFTGMLLNSSSLALTQDRRDNPNEELRAIGLANMASAVLGGLPTHHVGAPTIQAAGLNARGKKFVFATAIVVVTIVAVAGDWLSLLPRPVAGGVLASLGVGLFPEWKRRGFDNASTIDRILGIGIIATMVVFGILPGIAAGVVAAIIIFVVRYSRIGPIKRSLDSNSFRSNVDRRSIENEILDQYSGSTLVLMLHGYLFFGSVKQIEDTIYDRLDGDQEEPLRYLILGFRDVTGLGPSAVSAFDAINKLARSRGIDVVWSGARDATWAAPYGDSFGAEVVHQPDLDRAMAWCEDQTLAEFRDDMPPSTMGKSSSALQRVFTAYGTKRAVEKGETLMHVGDEANSVFFVAEGSLTAWLERDAELLARFSKVAPGSLIGEVAFATGDQRTATVIADSASVVWELTLRAMGDATRQEPAVAAEFNAYMLKRVAERLAATNETVAELLRGEG